MNRFGIGLIVIALLCESPTESSAGTITTYSDRPTFESALGGPITVETFTSSYHFPISTGVLNSATNLVVDSGGAINPGDIQPGATYSTAIGTSYFFNIDSGGGFDGGFLDGFTQTDPNPLTVTFDSPVAGFGFDTNSLMGASFSIDIQFSSGPDYTGTFPNPSGFYGFLSDAQDITSVQILGSGESGFAFALDNFTFSETSAAVPEPCSLIVWSLVGGIFGVGGLRRRMKRAAA